MKLAVEELESEALVGAITGLGPYVTSIVGEIETVRVCARVNVPPSQVDELLDGLVVVALDEDVRRLAVAAGSPVLRTLDAIHLATALSLGRDVEQLATYDTRLSAVAEEAGLRVLTPR